MDQISRGVLARSVTNPRGTRIAVADLSFSSTLNSMSSQTIHCVPSPNGLSSGGRRGAMRAHADRTRHRKTTRSVLFIVSRCRARRALFPEMLVEEPGDLLERLFRLRRTDVAIVLRVRLP